MAENSILSLVASGLLAGLVLHGPSASAQDTACDPLLDNRVDGLWAYSQREGRCEGLYVEQVSGDALAIVSFTSAFDDFDFDSGKPVVVEWTSPRAGQLHLRARSLEPKVYYRMDSMQPAVAESFRWPVEVLAGVGIERASLGVLGSMERCVGGKTRRVLVPLRIGQAGGTVAKETYELMVRPGVELKEVYLSVARVNDDGVEEDYLVDEAPLEYFYYPAERAFPIELPNLPRKGLYYILVVAELTDGADTAIEAYLDHPGG